MNFEATGDGTDFWTPIYTLVTRKVSRRNPLGGNATSSEVVELLPEEAIDRVSALKMVTTWASEYMLAEDTIGTLEPGKYADFAVLEKDFFTIPIEDVRSLKVVMTGLSGKVVYDAAKQAASGGN